MKWWEWILFSLVRFCCVVLVRITNPIFRYVYEDKRKLLPTSDSPLLKKPCVALAHMIRTRMVTSEEVVGTFINQVKNINPIVNAVIVQRFEEALVEAKKIDEILDSDDIPEEYSVENKPFLGLPFTAKEAFAITGLPNTSGLLARKSLVASENADAVALYREAGAIPIGLTNCSELCMWYETSNLIYKRTCNAYHAGRIVGGSSGGEGCCQSIAGAAFGIGSDIGGSIRIPTFFNGIFGHKCTTGVVSNGGQFPNAINEGQTFLSTGPMCRYASDIGPLFKVLVKPQYRDQLKLDEKVNLSKLKYFYMDCDGGVVGSAVDPQIKQAIDKAVTHIESSTGVPVEKVNLRKLRHSFAIWTTMMTTSNDHSFCSLMGNFVKEVNPGTELLLWLMGCPRHTIAAIGLGIAEKLTAPLEIQQKLRGMCEALKEEFQQLLGNDGVFLYPAHPRPAPYHNQPLVLIPNFAYTGIFNVLGMPCTSVPMGLSQEGVPIGFQVAGAQFSDRLTIAVAEELGSAFGGWVPPFQSS